MDAVAGADLRHERAVVRLDDSISFALRVHCAVNVVDSAGHCARRPLPGGAGSACRSRALCERRVMIRSQKSEVKSQKPETASHHHATSGRWQWLMIGGCMLLIQVFLVPSAFGVLPTKEQKPVIKAK